MKPERNDWDLALLLDVPDGSAERTAAEHHLAASPAMCREFANLQETALVLSALGEAMNEAAGEVALVDDVMDAVCHLQWESQDPAQHPFHDLEQLLESSAGAWEKRAPMVDLVAPVMEAAAASRKSDLEVELAFAPLSEALNDLGDSWRDAAPMINIVDGVMARVADATTSPANVVPMRARPAAQSVTEPRDRGWWRVAAGAAALLAVTGAWWLYPSQSAKLSPRVAEGGLSESTGLLSTEESEPDFTRVENFDTKLMAENAQQTDENTQGHRDGKASSTIITLRDAIIARQRALENDAATFVQLATLTPDEASRLLEEANLSLEALLGAAEFLSPADAAALLRAAMVNDPDNESLKYALAQRLAGDPEYAAEREQQLQSLLALNENNALPNYMLAADYMARGDVGLGMDALARGAAYGEANTYSLESMRQREAVLRASGLDPDVARYLAVSTGAEAGVSDIASLRSELLGYGAYYEQQGDLDTAQQIYNAVNQLGVQITEGADLAALRQAGLQTQQEAIYAIQGLAEVLQQPEYVAILGNTLNVLAESIFEMTDYINTAQSVVNNPQATSAEWGALIQHILTNGDTDIANLLGR